MDARFLPLRRRSLTGLLAGAGLPVLGQAATLRMVSDAATPHVMPAGHPLGEGIDVDIARQALASQGVTGLQLQILPWRRALAQLERGEADFAPAMRRTPEREAFLAFSRPYGTSVQHLLLSRAGMPLAVRSLRDLQGLRIGVVQGYAYPAQVVQAVGPRLVRVNDQVALLRMAAAGRFDAALISALAGIWMVHELGLADALRHHPLVVDEGRQTQFAVSRRSPHAQALLSALDRGLAKFDAAAWQRFERPYLKSLQAL
jgi:polar amino acid transport system substrate-binding protein